MEALYVLLAVIFILAVIAIVIDWLVHIEMVKNKGVKWGWGNYNKFKREFKRIEKEDGIDFRSFAKDGIFSNGWSFDSIIYVYANTITFNSKGMIINNPISYLMTRIYTHNYIKKNSPFVGKKEKEERVKW